MWLVWKEVLYIQWFCYLVEWVGCDRKTNEKHDKDCVEEGFHVAKVKLDICGEGQRRYSSGVL